MPQRTVDSPIGPIRIVSEDGRLVSLRINPPNEADETGDDALLDEAAHQIAQYFGGERDSFDLPLAPAATARGSMLRAAIANIRHGSTARYGEIAQAAGSSARAVGQACARNPLPLIIPCHRVLGGSGPGHYSAGDGVRTKQWLLAHEADDLWAK